MSRTTEQIDADEALTEAIEQVWKSYSEEGDPGGVLVEYVIVANYRTWDEDGDSITTTLLHNRDDAVPLSNQLGMAEFLAARVRKAINED
ncbi:hypothetical protein [Rhodococcus pyridinivorans]|uniref:hypothetical protein n=1 Tax=Rhodococcus pyridinivorans TaxID=103816 RepID=UPI003AADF2AF